MEFYKFSHLLHQEISCNGYRSLISFSYHEADGKDDFYDKLIHFGTGFLLTRFSEKNEPHHFIITAKHVIDDAMAYDLEENKEVVCSFPTQECIKPTDKVDYKFISFRAIKSQFNSYEEHDISFVEITNVFTEILLSGKDRINLKTLQFTNNTEADPFCFIFGLPAAINKYKNIDDIKSYRFNWRLLMTPKMVNPLQKLIDETTIKNPIFLEFNRKEITNVENISPENQKGIPDGNFIRTDGMSGSPFCIGSSVKGVLIEIYPDRKISPFPTALIVSDLKEIIEQIDSYIETYST